MFGKTAILAVLSVLLATAGQLLLRSGMQKVGYVGGERIRRPFELIGDVASTPAVVIGLVIFAVSAVSWLLVLSRVPLSVAYPFVGLTYVLTTLFGKVVLKEQVPGARWLGIGLIIGGIIIVGLTSTEDAPGSAAEPAVVAGSGKGA